MDLFKDILPSIFVNKVPVINDENQGEYSPYIVNMAMSHYIDCVLHGNEMNKNSNLSKKMQYDYYFYAIRKKKRYSAWIKKGAEEDLLAIKEFYSVSIEKAKEILNILTPEQVKELTERVKKGG